MEEEKQAEPKGKQTKPEKKETEPKLNKTIILGKDELFKLYGPTLSSRPQFLLSKIGTC